MKTFCFSGSRQMVAVQYSAIYDAAARPVSMSYFISDIEWRKLNSSVINNWYLTCKRQYFDLGISFFGQNFTLFLQYGWYFTLYLFWGNFTPISKLPLPPLWKDLAKYGITVVRDVPGNLDKLKTLTRQIGFVKRTHYGDFWHVKVMHDANNLVLYEW